MIYSFFDAIYDTYSTAIFDPPGERRAAGALRRLDRAETDSSAPRQAAARRPAHQGLN